MSWRNTTLGECLDLVSGPAFKSRHFTDDPSDVPLVKGENIGQGQILWDKSKYWPRADADVYERFALKPGDVVLAMDRPWVTAGLKYAVISDSDPQSLLVQRVARLRGKGQLSSRFLRYVVASPEFCGYVKNIMGGTNVPHISGDQIRAYRVQLPPRPVQEAIASVLSSYDDLIENNRRRMQLLEQAARLLYKEWFVHLRFPGHENVKIVDGVPAGWALKPLREVVQGIYDGPHATPAEADEGPVFLGIKNLTDTGSLDLSSVRHISESEFPRWTKRVTPQEGDIVFSYEATLHLYGLIPSGFRGCLGRRLALVRAEPERRNRHFLFLTFLSDRWRGVVESNKISGATVDRIPLAKFPNFMVLCPTELIVREFEDHANTLFRQISILTTQIDKLRSARDLLLPKLMNGYMLAYHQ